MEKYAITTQNGTLTVNKRDITLQAVSDSKTYDGKALKNDNVKASGSLASGDKFRDKDGVRFSVLDSKGNLVTNGAVNVGVYSKVVTEVHIVDAKGNEVTDNYNVKKVDGTLTIKQGTTSQNDSTKPRTGDENSLGLWIGLLAVSAVLILAVLVILLVRSRKKQQAQPVEEIPEETPEESRNEPQNETKNE